MFEALNMKKWIQRIAGFFAIVSLFIACSKDSGPEFFVKIKTDSGWVTFDGVGEYGIDTKDSNFYKILVNGTRPESLYSFDILVRKQDTVPIPPGLYMNNSIDYDVIVSYSRPDDLNNLEYFHSAEDVPNREPSSYSVKFLNITDEIIEGNFFGNYLTKTGTIDSTLVTITEGSFRVKRFR